MNNSCSSDKYINKSLNENHYFVECKNNSLNQNIYFVEYLTKSLN